MAAIDDGLSIELGPQHARAALALSDEANWNQTEDDWRFFLTHGTVLGVLDPAGHLVATAALLPYTAGVAWISMVLVTSRWRRRGLARSLLQGCLRLAEVKGLTTFLDATPAGAEVYGPIGFTPTLTIQRLGLNGTGVDGAASPERHSAGTFDDLLAQDRRAMGFDRGALLAELCARPGSRLLARDGALGLIRQGRQARHIGPVFADHPDQALALVQHIVHAETGPLLIDAADTSDRLLQGLNRFGWRLQRPFQRMRLGIAAVAAAMPPMAGAGPEFG